MTATAKKTEVKDLLTEHNEAATAIGAMKLKAWKGSKKDLQDRIEGLKRQAAEKKVSKTDKKAKKEKPEDDGRLTIVQVATKIGMDPKVARAKLRRNGMKSNEGRWERVEEGSKEHQELVDLLKGRKAAE